MHPSSATRWSFRQNLSGAYGPYLAVAITRTTRASRAFSLRAAHHRGAPHIHSRCEGWLWDRVLTRHVPHGRIRKKIFGMYPGRMLGHGTREGCQLGLGLGVGNLTLIGISHLGLGFGLGLRNKKKFSFDFPINSDVFRHFDPIIELKNYFSFFSKCWKFCAKMDFFQNFK